eukprot:9903436-Alexandrium_andersonii.AAC.1
MAQRHMVQLAAYFRRCRDAVCACGRLLAGTSGLGLVCVCGRCPRAQFRRKPPERGRGAAARGPHGWLNGVGRRCHPASAGPPPGFLGGGQLGPGLGQFVARPGPSARI